MPVYEYKCSECDECFEIKQSFNDKPVTACHRCGSEARRVFRPAPIIFKGSGFYVTDHAKDKHKRTDSKGNGEKPPVSGPIQDIAKPDNSSVEKKADTNPTSKKEESSGS